MRSVLTFAACLALSTSVLSADGGRPMSIEDLFRFQRVSDPQPRPDGMTVAYCVTTFVPADNKASSSIWLADIDGLTAARPLTNADKTDRHPRWSPDGRKVLFESNRDGGNQLWVIDVRGGEARKLTSISTEAGNGIWSRDGTKIAFVSAVYPENSDKPFHESDRLNKERMKAIEDSPVKARVHSQLPYRIWDSYVEGKRQHLFVMSGDGGEPRDATPGDRDAFPTFDTFSVGENFAFSQDGKYLVFAAAAAEDVAWSTNFDIYRVPLAGAGKEWETLTKGNLAADVGPTFSSDGTMLAYLAQSRPGFEADKWDVMVVDVDSSGAFTGKPRPISADVDRLANGFAWAPDGKSVFFNCDDNGAGAIYRAPLDGQATRLGDGLGQIGSLSATGPGPTLVFTESRMTRPNEVSMANLGLGSDLKVRDITRSNEALCKDLNFGKPESVTIAVEGGLNMQMWLLKPPGFDPTKKWPVAFLVHGGPQDAWADAWLFRWNAQLWAAQGYVVALPNPRGSEGFGQKFVDEISGDWGGKCYRDLMKGADYVERLPYVDPERIGAAGASFGGYMMNWFAVNTGRFKCLVAHGGVWNLESTYASMDELWFFEWEQGGPPWGEKRSCYEAFSPHRFAGNLGRFRTPMLVIQNDLDFRCPVGQGSELFGSLQRQGVPSRFINFPDEGHWVLKPRNSEFWHKEVFAWFAHYVPPGGR